MNKIQINVQEGFEIDQHKSDLSKGIIEFKPVEKKKLSYEDIAKELFQGKRIPYLTEEGTISNTVVETSFNDPNYATSKEQLECLMAYNKLRNVAEYLNKNFNFDPKKSSQSKWFLYYNIGENKLKFAVFYSSVDANILFASKQLAEQAIEILGEEEIKKALFIY